MAAAAAKKNDNENNNGQKYYLEKMVLAFVATVFTAVSLWLGSTVNTMSQEVAKLSVILENQVKLSDAYKVSLDAMSAEIRAIKIEQAKRTTRVYEMQQLSTDVKFLKTELKRLSEAVIHLRSRFDEVQRDIDSRRNKRWNKPDQDAFELKLQKVLDDIEERLRDLEKVVERK